MNDTNKEVDSETLGAIAGDAITIFRTGMFLMVVYVSILSLSLREGGTEFITYVLGSSYTIFGFTFWLGSVSWSAVTYRAVRRTSVQESYSQLGVIDDRFAVVNYISTCLFALLIALLSLVFGLLEAWGNAVSQEPSGIPLTNPITFVGISFVFVLSVNVLLSLMEMFRDRYGSFRSNLPDN